MFDADLFLGLFWLAYHLIYLMEPAIPGLLAEFDQAAKLLPAKYAGKYARPERKGLLALCIAKHNLKCGFRNAASGSMPGGKLSAT